MRVGSLAAVSALVLSACATVSPPAPSSGVTLAPPAAAAAAAPAAALDLSPEAVKARDPFLWLEEREGDRALAWVAEQNAKARARLDGDRRFAAFRDQALAIFTAEDRIPTPSFRAGGVDNFWQDKAYPKGLWRHATLASYRTASPQWKTVLDVGALARAEGKNWVWKGASCLEPEERLCLVSLSNGGEDAVEVREFDATTGKFVDGGFRLPKGKHRLTWETKDSLLVATEFGPGALTESGYPYVVKRLKRGQTLAQAETVFEGSKDDGGYGVSPRALRDANGALNAVLIERPLDTFRSEYWTLTPKGPVKLDMPSRATVYGLSGEKLVFTADEEWRGFDAGTLVAVQLELLDPGSRAKDLSEPAVFTPATNQSVQEVAITRDRIVVSVLEDVKGRLYSFRDSGHRGWARTGVDLPDMLSIDLVDASRSRDELFVSAQGFLTPSSLLSANGVTGKVETLKSLPARFDASKYAVEQFFATSKDGTRVPYFIVHARDLKYDGSNPTLEYGYGGFQVSKPPVYLPEAGKLWLDNGGVYVIANIRGGGEYGPVWHQSVLREKRQGAFDDFYAVAEDLIARKITSPRHLGIYGRSNGGVLTSVAITQRPDLYNAAVIESPLVDMLRYHELPAGASWIGEYGDPRKPEDAAFIAKYSGYQALKPGQTYPEPYLTTNTRDDRVHPGHARKFAAKMQSLGYPVIYFEDTEGGHSYDSDPFKNAERWARHYVYLSQKLAD